MKRVVALIGARSGSKGVPDKNIRPLGGRPLMAWSILTALSVPEIARVYVSTDSPFYADRARDFGAHVIMRPSEFARDDSPDSEFIFHALSKMTPRPDLIVHLRPTTPIRDAAYIRGAIQALNPDATALRSFHIMPESAFKSILLGTRWMTSLKGSRDMDKLNNPRQSFSKTGMPNGYVDILKPDHMEATGKIHGERVQPFETPYVTEADTEEDFALLEMQANALCKSEPIIA